MTTKHSDREMLPLILDGPEAWTKAEQVAAAANMLRGKAYKC